MNPINFLDPLGGHVIRKVILLGQEIEILAPDKEEIKSGEYRIRLSFDVNGERKQLFINKKQAIDFAFQAKLGNPIYKMAWEEFYGHSTDIISESAFKLWMKSFLNNSPAIALSTLMSYLYLAEGNALNKIAGTKGGTEGIYEFAGKSGKNYVGQSGNIPSRLSQHLKSGKLSPRNSVTTTEVLGGKTAREIAEQVRINQLGGIQNLENIRNPIGATRQWLLDFFR
jgi:hypothetical protein